MQPITVTKTNSEKLNTEVNFRCNDVVKSDFYACSVANGVVPAKKMRELMSDYINENRHKISQIQSKAQ